MNPCPFAPDSSVAAYLRDSGGDAQDLSTAQQEKQIRTWCKENNLVLSRIFRDEAAPGSSTVGRNGFLAMMDHFRHKAPEAGIIIWSLSRFAREIDDAQFYKADLRRRGYLVHSLNENIPAGLDGRFFEAAVDWMNAKFLEGLSDDVKRGQSHNITVYGAIGGTPPRGMRRIPVEIGTRRDGKPHVVHRWDPDPELVPLVQRAFAMRAMGLPLSQIQNEAPLYNVKWSWVTFFRNPIYKGELKYGKHRIPNYCEAIVDAETWRSVQTTGKNHKVKKDDNPAKHPRAIASDYILTGLLKCELCGSWMHGHTVKFSRATRKYYACSMQKKSFGEDCAARMIPKDEVEQAILQDLMQVILNTQNVIDLQRMRRDGSAEEIADLKAKLKLLKRHNTKLTGQINRLSDAIANYGHSQAVMESLRKKETELAENEDEITSGEMRIERLKNQPGDEEIINLAENLRTVFATKDRETLRRWLHVLVDHVDAQRLKRSIKGVIWYFEPGELAGNSMPELCAPKGACVHRHRFTHPLTRHTTA